MAGTKGDSHKDVSDNAGNAEKKPPESNLHKEAYAPALARKAEADSEQRASNKAEKILKDWEKMTPEQREVAEAKMHPIFRLADGPDGGKAYAEKVLKDWEKMTPEQRKNVEAEAKKHPIVRSADEWPDGVTPAAETTKLLKDWEKMTPEQRKNAEAEAKKNTWEAL